MMNTDTPLNLINNKTLESAQSANPNYHDICNALHTTLEYDQLISIFSKKIISIVPHTAYAYINYEMEQSIIKGIFTKHSCNYALQFDKQPLGEFRLMRNFRFEDVELQVLEVLICCLIYPLKNATLYHKALKMAQVQPMKTLLHNNDTIASSFGAAFSQGINALVEHNRKQLAQNNRCAQGHSNTADDNPWAIGFYR